MDVVHNCWGNLFNKNSQNKHIDEKIDYNKQSEHEDQRRENMNIKIISVGKLKEKYLIQGINEYVKRLNAYAKIELIEVPDEKAPENLSEAQMRQVKEKEGERILAKIKEQEYVYALAIEGKNPTSESFAKQIDQLGIQGKKPPCFCYRRLFRTQRSRHEKKQCSDLFWKNDVSTSIDASDPCRANLPCLPDQCGGALS